MDGCARARRFAAERSTSALNRMMRVASRFDRKQVESPQGIAKHTMWAIKKGTYLVTTQSPLGGYFQVLSRGFFAPTTWLGCLVEVLLASPLRLLSLLAGHGLGEEMKKEYRRIKQGENDFDD